MDTLSTILWRLTRLDVVEDGVPAAQMARHLQHSMHADAPLIVVGEVTKTRGISNGEAESRTILFDTSGNEN